MAPLVETAPELDPLAEDSEPWAVDDEPQPAMAAPRASVGGSANRIRVALADTTTTRGTARPRAQPLPGQ
jgi:hypothetical protein